MKEETYTKNGDKMIDVVFLKSSFKVKLMQTRMKGYIFLLFSFCFLFENITAQNRWSEKPIVTNPTNKVVLSKDVKYDQLNPARGDKSPMAGDIWGNRKDTVASGFLLKFADGFSSPLHIHNITYRAIVINGLVNNGDENAEKMWMPTGSFWTQPLGAGHITAAKGKNALAYVEIDNGPYLVEPTDGAFITKEKPINIDISNVVWLNKSITRWIENGDAEIGFLWNSNNDDGIKGFLIKLPKLFVGNIFNGNSISCCSDTR